MKQLIKYFTLFAILISLSTCEKDPPSIGEPFSQLEGITDSWVLQKVEQKDELSKTVKDPIDISFSALGTSPSVITFDANDKSYNLSAGTSKQFIPESGSWAFDDDQYPTKIILTGNGNAVELNMQAPVRKVEEFLIVKYIRPFDGCTTIEGEIGAVSYTYTYKRQ